MRSDQDATARDTALYDVLRLIRETRDDEAPVFDAILKSAAQLCEAPFAALIMAKPGDAVQRMVAGYGAEAGTVAYYEAGHVPMEPEKSFAAQAICEGRVIHLHDMCDTDAFRAGVPNVVALAEIQGIRTNLFVPLITEDGGIGCFILFRKEVRPFDDAQIALVQSFADQAVIAVEKVRQFREVQTQLEREAATREVLHVISQNQSDEMPVFDAILNRAARLCQATTTALGLLTPDRTEIAYVHQTGRPILSFKPGVTRWPAAGNQAIARAIQSGTTIHEENMADSDLYRAGDPTRVALVDEADIRSVVAVPLMQGDQAIGVIAAHRHGSAAEFEETDIQLLETFAAQAVIAIENVRQFREVQTRLERERASAEVLGTISQSRDDELPVFHTILESASRLCHAPIAFLSVANAERTQVRIPAYRGTRSEFGDILADFEEPITRTELVAVRPIVDGQILRQDDITNDETYRAGDLRRRQMADVEGARSVLCVPLMKDGVALGAIVLYRREIAPFSDDDVALVQNFAAQAVIAIENVRQFREVQIRLERERASAEVLALISQSRDDAAPVFDAILERGARLCASDYAGLALMSSDGTELVYTAHHGPDLAHSQHGEMRWTLDGKSSFAEAIALKRPVQIDDLADTDLYRSGDPQRVAHVDQDGLHSFMAVPLILNDTAIGAFGIARFSVNPFNVDDRALIESFAAQAVIAIENVRQFKALETLNTELGDRVEAQVGELERMGRLKRFLPEQVADAVVSSGDDAMLSSHRALISALFCDIRGFTAFCETAEPEETIEVLQTYHEEMGKLISGHGAGVDHRAGDGIMVLFNDPLPCDDPAGDALRLAFAMRDVMADLCKRWRKLGHRLGFGVGISLGYATVGMVGSEGRFHYTASGTAVNLAARLCDMAADGEILLSPRAWIAVEEKTEGERVGEVEIKGISAPVEVWRATGPRAVSP